MKYWPSSHDFNKLVIKAKMHAKITYIYFLFSLLYKNTKFFSFERLGRMHENKSFFFLENPGIFNTGFVFLRYKNTDQY